MKLVQINICNFGSTGKIMKQIHDVSIKKGIDSWCFYGKGKNQESDIRVQKFLSTRDYLLHIGASLLFDKGGFASREDTKQLIRQIDNIKPDIIHLHNIHSFVLNLEMIFEYIKQNKINLVWTLHDSWGFTAFCGNPEFFGCEKWRDECYQCPHRLSKLGKMRRGFFFDYSKYAFRRKKYAFSNVDSLKIVCPSNWLKKHVQQSFLNYGDIRTIHNGIDLNVFSPSALSTYPGGEKAIRIKYGIPDQCTVLLGVASVWSDSKGLDTFVQMLDIIDESSKIVLVGLNEKQIRKLPNKIIGIKRTENQNELAALYAVADVFINPSMADTYPTVNMEAIACGTPVVTYDTNGSPESIGEGCGFVVKQGDIKELVKKSEDAIEMCDRNECREFAERAFDYKKCIDEYLDIYTQITTEF